MTLLDYTNTNQYPKTNLKFYKFGRVNILFNFLVIK